MSKKPRHKADKPTQEGESPADQDESPASEAEEDFQEKYLLALAELRNISARHEKALADARKRGAEPLAAELLESLDNLKRACALPDCAESVQGGLRLVVRGFEEAFARFGIVPFDALGAQLDPARHEVMAEQESPAPAGTIIQEIQGGWLIHGRLLRAARVVVAKPQDAPQGQEAVTKAQLQAE